MSSFQAWVAECSQRIHTGLLYYLEDSNYPAAPLQASMAYAVLNGGKRIRPLLVYASGAIFDAPLENLDLAAIAIELIHSYSLVHDDLPAMDNAAWRRGQPSCFKAYGEALAILAGDALQTLAFEVLATHPAPLSTAKRLEMVKILSRASGPSGMAGGQTLDILNVAQAGLSEKELVQLYQLKTGALIEASIRLGLVSSSSKSLKQKQALERFATAISLAFQIQDDILDIEGKHDEIGKLTGLDQAQEKTTYPSLVGLEAAKKKVAHLFQHAFHALEALGPQADILRQLTDSVGKRAR